MFLVADLVSFKCSEVNRFFCVLLIGGGGGVGIVEPEHEILILYHILENS